MRLVRLGSKRAWAGRWEKWVTPACIDPEKPCSGVNLERKDTWHGDGRRNQAFDSQAQERVGDGDPAGEDDGSGGDRKSVV